VDKSRLQVRSINHSGAVASVKFPLVIRFGCLNAGLAWNAAGVWLAYLYKQYFKMHKALYFLLSEACFEIVLTI